MVWHISDGGYKPITDRNSFKKTGFSGMLHFGFPQEMQPADPTGFILQMPAFKIKITEIPG